MPPLSQILRRRPQAEGIVGAGQHDGGQDVLAVGHQRRQPDGLGGGEGRAQRSRQRASQAQGAGPRRHCRGRLQRPQEPLGRALERRRGPEQGAGAQLGLHQGRGRGGQTPGEPLQGRGADGRQPPRLRRRGRAQELLDAGQDVRARDLAGAHAGHAGAFGRIRAQQRPAGGGEQPLGRHRRQDQPVAHEPVRQTQPGRAVGAVGLDGADHVLHRALHRLGALRLRAPEVQGPARRGRGLAALVQQPGRRLGRGPEVAAHQPVHQARDRGVRRHGGQAPPPVGWLPAVRAQDPLGDNARQIGLIDQGGRLAVHELALDDVVQLVGEQARVAGLRHGQRPGGRQVPVVRQQPNDLPLGHGAGHPRPPVLADRRDQAAPAGGRGGGWRPVRVHHERPGPAPHRLQVRGRDEDKIEADAGEALQVPRSGEPLQGGEAQQSARGRRAGALEGPHPQRGLVGRGAGDHDEVRGLVGRAPVHAGQDAGLEGVGHGAQDGAAGRGRDEIGHGVVVDGRSRHEGGGIGQRRAADPIGAEGRDPAGRTPQIRRHEGGGRLIGEEDEMAHGVGPPGGVHARGGGVDQDGPNPGGHLREAPFGGPDLLRGGEAGQGAQRVEAGLNEAAHKRGAGLVQASTDLHGLPAGDGPAAGHAIDIGVQQLRGGARPVGPGYGRRGGGHGVTAV